MLAVLVLATACAGRPEAPIIRQPASGAEAAATAARLDALLPADVLLVGEQHDAPEHHRLEQEIIAHLARRGLLAAVALEMADAGVSTARLKPSSSEEQAQHALKWDNKGWPWADYGPAVMTAVQADIPVLGANLPRALMRDSMADSQLDGQLPGPALKAQQQLIRSGHCDLLPEIQVTPMTRIQISKDITMANTLSQALLPGKVVLLLAGTGHVDRKLGVPQHLSADLKVKVIRLRAGPDTGKGEADAFDSVWSTPELPDKDYCAGLEKSLTGSPGMP